MTDTPPGENDIESLAQRAKEVLDRVRANTDDADWSLGSADDTVDEADTADESAEIEEADVPVEPEPEPEAEEPEEDGDEEGDGNEDEEGDEDDDSALAGAAAVGGGAGYIASLASDDPGEIELPEPSVAATDDSFTTAEEDAFSLDAEVTDDEPAEAEPAELSTALVPTASFDADSLRSDDEDDDDDRKRGCLLPLILLALLILALLYLASQVFGGDDEDPLLVEDPGVSAQDDADDPSGGDGSGDADDSDGDASGSDDDNDASGDAGNDNDDQGAGDGSESDDASADSSTSSTTTSTTTTEAPPVIPDTSWDLLGTSSETDLFASFGEPFGLRSIMEEGAGPEFTVFAPSNDAISELTQEQIGGFADDPASAEALLGYHIVDQRLTPDILLDAAGGQLLSRVGLPIDVTLDGDEFVLNGSARVSSAELESGNGNVLVIDSVLTPPTINAVIDLGEVQFEVISAIITEAGQNELQKAVTFFEENPDVSAVIEGHTDTDGPSEPNQRLSERRANAVRDFLISQGIDGDRLTAQGFGETDPILVDGVEDKAASRRIEFNIR